MGKEKGERVEQRVYGVVEAKIQFNIKSDQIRSNQTN